jgi:hypothetical protein
MFFVSAPLWFFFTSSGLRNWLTQGQDALIGQPAKRKPRLRNAHVREDEGAPPRHLAVHQSENLARKPLGDMRGILTRCKLVPKLAPVDMHGLSIGVRHHQLAVLYDVMPFSDPAGIGAIYGRAFVLLLRPLIESTGTSLSSGAA